MPQMAPLMWTLLFIFFTMNLFAAMIKISFSKKENQSPEISISPSNMKSNMNWKW